MRRREVVESADQNRPTLALDWSDVPMVEVSPGVHEVRMPLVEVGSFLAKACFFLVFQVGAFKGFAIDIMKFWNLFRRK